MRLNFYLRGLNKTELSQKPKMNWSGPNAGNRWRGENGRPQTTAIPMDND